MLDRLKALARFIDYHKCRHDWGRAKTSTILIYRRCRKNEGHVQIFLGYGGMDTSILNRFYRWDEAGHPDIPIGG